MRTHRKIEGMLVEDISPRVAYLLGQRPNAENTDFRPLVDYYIKAVDLTDDLIRAAARPQREQIFSDLLFPLLQVRFRPDAAPKFYLSIDERHDDDPARIFLANCRDRTVAEARAMARRRHLEVSKFGVPKRPFRMRRGVTVREGVDAYFEHAFQSKTAWRTTVQSLFNAYLLSPLGDRAIARIRRAEWLDHTDRIALFHPSRGNNFHKALKAWLSFCVEAGAIDANPLAKTQLPAPPQSKSRLLDFEAIIAINEAADALGEPWRAMIGLIIATGETADDVRQMHGDDVDLKRHEWCKRHRLAPHEWRSPPELCVPLSTFALDLLKPYANHKERLFTSTRRKRFETPLYLRTDIVAKLNATANVRGPWTIHDLRRSVLRLTISDKLSRADALEKWGKKIQKEVESMRDDQVTL